MTSEQSRHYRNFPITCVPMRFVCPFCLRNLVAVGERLCPDSCWTCFIQIVRAHAGEVPYPKRAQLGHTPGMTLREALQWQPRVIHLSIPTSRQVAVIGRGPGSGTILAMSANEMWHNIVRAYEDCS